MGLDFKFHTSTILHDSLVCSKYIGLYIKKSTLYRRMIGHDHRDKMCRFVVYPFVTEKPL